MFKSFWMAGFEGSTGYDRNRRWFDHVKATGHDRAALGDYRAAKAMGLSTVRDTVRWPLVDRGKSRYDFSSLVPILDAANETDVDVIWDLFHYGYPEHVDLFSEDFPKRLADYAAASAHVIARTTRGPHWFTPINEPSFLAFAAGEEGLFAPWARGRGDELKIALVRAAISAIDAIRSIAPSARFVNIDPLCHVVPAHGTPVTSDIQHFNTECVYAAWDMLSGRTHPELGGSPSHLDCVGINYYWTNQWEWGARPAENGVVPTLAPDDPRRRSLRDLVRDVWNRYGADIVITETSHMGDARADWIHHVAREARALHEDGIPLKGICLYPILGMPEWHEPEVWIPMGLWEPSSKSSPHLGRTINPAMRDALLEVQLKAGAKASL